MITWFAKWRERREMRRLRLGFDELRHSKPNWGGQDEKKAFCLFCQLEALGSDRVRAMLSHHESFDFTVH
jgi:hypothetical protein